MFNISIRSIVAAILYSTLTFGNFSYADFQCPAGELVLVPLNGQTIDWNGSQLQSYIDNNNIPIPSVSNIHYEQATWAQNAISHYCQAQYGYTLNSPSNNWGSTFPVRINPTNQYNQTIQQGIEFQCKLCSDGRAIPAGSVEIIVDIDDISIPILDDQVQKVRKGMTWKKNNTSSIAGIVDVGCGAEPNKCNPYQGDTECTNPLPLLCFNDIEQPKPSWVPSPQYHRWSGGIVATTQPIAPHNEPLLSQSITEANQYCASKFGTGWRVAEFHDGWAWNFKAYGNVGTDVNRFWVDINDQNANCWVH